MNKNKIINKMKVCSKCKINRKISEYSKGQDVGGSIRSRCKFCCSEDYKIYRLKNPRTEENKEKQREYMKSYRKRNKEIVKEYNKKYHKNKMETDINYKIAVKLRKRLCIAITNNQKLGSAVKDLGCSISELKEYLESKFKTGMSWDNWAIDGWHIDHIEPLSSFDLTDRKQFLEACHYSNLQPLWAEDNLQKGGKYVQIYST